MGVRPLSETLLVVMASLRLNTAARVPPDPLPGMLSRTVSTSDTHLEEMALQTSRSKSQGALPFKRSCYVSSYPKRFLIDDDG